jgi:hypothetical protein
LRCTTGLQPFPEHRRAFLPFAFSYDVSLSPPLRVRAALFAIEARQNMTLIAESISTSKTNRTSLTIQIEALLSRLHPSVERERRHDDRVAIPVLFRLTPLDADREPLEQEASIVVGKNISRRGVSFYHEKPITHRRAVIELADPSVGCFVAEVDISWCRFTKPGWYESGGRLIRTAAPIAESSTAAEPQVTGGIPDVSTQLASEYPVTGT